MRTRKSLVIALASILLVAPLLSGCSLINQFLPGGGGSVIPGQSVPSDFPDDVPLIEGDVLLGITVPGDSGEKAWNVTIKVSGVDAYDTIVADMQAAGFEYQELASTAESKSAGFTKAPHSVIVVVTQADGDWTANYTVTDAATQ